MSGPEPATRVPFAPLQAAIPHDDFKDLAARLNVGRETLYRWKANGVPIDAADTIACNAGKHPSEIWTDWYDIP